MTMVGIDFNNAGKGAAVAEIIVRPSMFDRGTIGLLLRKVDLTEAKEGSFGVEGCSSSRTTLSATGTYAERSRMRSTCRALACLDRNHLWVFSSTQVSRLAGIRLQPGRHSGECWSRSHKRDVPTLVAPRVSIEQKIGGVSVGGSTFQIGYDGQASPAQPRPRRLRIIADHLQWQEGKGRRRRSDLWVEDNDCRGPGPNRSEAPGRRSGSSPHKQCASTMVISQTGSR